MGLALIFVSFEPARCDDHVNLQVSCTIPAVPGLNAPLVEETSVAAKENKEEQEVPQVEKNQQETVVEERDGEHAIVKTFYAR
jgi:hypothetical protein